MPVLRHAGVALVALSICVLVVCAQGAPQPRVVFLVGTRVATAEFKQTALRELVVDAEPKAEPRWSPAADRIAYAVAAPAARTDPKKHADLVVIDATGRRVATVPVLASEPDGTIVGGMRFVERSGWHADDLLFASGSVGPRSAEYRILDLSGRVRTSYFGSSFATCPAKGQVAYVAPDTSAAPSVEVNGARVYTADRPEAQIGSLTWSGSCERLALTQRLADSLRLVVFRNGTIEANLPVPASPAPVAVVASRTGFALTELAEPQSYDAATRSLRPSPDAARADAQARELADFVQGLGGRSAHWWYPPVK